MYIRNNLKQDKDKEITNLGVSLAVEERNGRPVSRKQFLANKKQ
jgi:hypothetical protein